MNNTIPAPVTFCGIQSGFGYMPDMELWNLTTDIEGHPEGSTVTRETLEKKGYGVPVAPVSA